MAARWTVVIAFTDMLFFASGPTTMLELLPRPPNLPRRLAATGAFGINMLRPQQRWGKPSPASSHQAADNPFAL